MILDSWLTEYSIQRLVKQNREMCGTYYENIGENCTCIQVMFASADSKIFKGSLEKGRLQVTVCLFLQEFCTKVTTFVCQCVYIHKGALIWNWYFHQIRPKACKIFSTISIIPCYASYHHFALYGETDLTESFLSVEYYWPD